MLNESRISAATPDDSQALENKNKSLDFANIPDLLGKLDDKNKNTNFENAASSPPIATTAAYSSAGTLFSSRPRFDYEHRFFNHFNINKMTMENQAYATINRGSFAENIDKRFDHTVDSENVSPFKALQ